MKNQKGITLIALIITIIVMLILVTVSVTVTINSGIFSKAKDAAAGTKAARDNELNIDSTMKATDIVDGTTVEYEGINAIFEHYTSF